MLAVDVQKQLGAFARRGRGQLGNQRAASRVHFQQPIGDELRHHLMSGVGVDFQFLAEGADGRKTVAGPHLARDDRLLGRVHDLLVDRYAGLKSQPEGDHACTISHSTLNKR